jgi:hypothetical protein
MHRCERALDLVFDQHLYSYERGKLAEQLVGDGEVVLVDSGTTGLAVARVLAGRRLTAMPLSIPAADVLAGRPPTKVVLPGGELRPGELTAIGPLAEAGIRALRFDTAVITRSRPRCTSPTVSSAWPRLAPGRFGERHADHRCHLGAAEQPSGRAGRRCRLQLRRRAGRSSPIVAELFVSLALWGLFQGSLDVSMNTQGVTVEKALGRPIMGTLHGSWSIGALSGAGIGVLAVAAGIPLRRQLLILGVAAVVVASWLATRLLRDVPSPQANQRIRRRPISRSACWARAWPRSFRCCSQRRATSRTSLQETRSRR